MIGAVSASTAESFWTCFGESGGKEIQNSGLTSEVSTHQEHPQTHREHRHGTSGTPRWSFRNRCSAHRERASAGNPVTVRQ